MSRIINRDSAGRRRTTLLKGIAVALRELSRQGSVSDESRDLAAFVALALREIAAGIDPSVAAWEKRGYWVKADKFRMDWAWTSSLAAELQAALMAGDWTTVADLVAQVAGKVSSIQVAERHRLGRPWLGAFQRLNPAAPSN